ncbi:MAG: TraB/GumN family protein [Gammaproteobacteria bacterium]
MRYWILLGLLLPGWVGSETSLWRVNDGNAELFIGGTVHVLGRSDYPLPPEFEQAYQKAEILVLETDLEALAEPKAQAQLMRRMRYHEGETLRTVLNDETFQALARYCKETNIPIESLLTFKPPLVVITLMMAELQRLGLAGSGMDDFFNRRAKTDGKISKGLETLEQQFDAIERMGQGHENELILSSLNEMEQLPAIMQDMKTAWRKGDLEALVQIGIEPMQTEYPALYEALLVDRNNAWLPKIAAMMADPERELILVGALHLAGREGLLEQLRRRGYKVEKY